jgi:hypothetical protein
MRNQEWESMNEKEFEEMLKSTILELPPEEIVESVTPWKKAIHYVLIGLALSTLTLNFWCLDYILPTIGIVLCLLGFRILRQENKWFRGCFFLAVIRVVYNLSIFILNTTIIPSTILNTTILNTTIASILTVVILLSLFAELFCFWRGLRAVQKKVGLTPHANGVVALIIWYVFVALLWVIEYSGWIIVIAMVIGYIFIIRTIYTISKELDEAGYSIQTASVKITDRTLVILIALFLLIGSICGYLFGASYPMEWTSISDTESSEVEEIKNHLLELGFPENILKDLSVEDIMACEGALRVKIDGTNLSTDSGETATDDDKNVLQITGIGVQLSSNLEKWMVFSHFLWKDNPNFYGTESVQLWPAYGNYEGWNSEGKISGRVLYDKDGKTFTSSYYSLKEQSDTFESIFGGEEIYTDIFATFSMPKKGEHYRGYVAYQMEGFGEKYTINTWINYTHQQNWLQYPVKTAMEKRMESSWDEEGAFITVQNHCIFNLTTEDTNDFD